MMAFGLRPRPDLSCWST